MNIDKDINRCKELIKTEHSNWIGMSNQDAIENVLSELEETKATLKCTQDSWYKDTQELETYKTLVDKYGGVEQLEKYLVEISQALGNVTICSAKTVIEDKNEVIRCLKEELETYKKIAEKLAYYIWKYDCCEYEIGKNGKCEGYYIDKDCTEKCIIDWARKEVENES